LTQFRLRSAYGASGVEPGTTDAVAFYSASTAKLESGDTPAVVFSALGNRSLKPERSTEVEVGFDANFANRFNAEFTYYSKVSKDALVSRILPPSLGTGLTSRLENLGEVRNVGWEALLNAQVFEKNALGWDITISGSSNSNKLVTLGGVPTIISSSTAQQREGYPLNGWWSRGIVSYEDKNKDGILTYNANAALSEVVVTDTAVYLGNPLPIYEVSTTNGFDLFHRAIRISAMIDYKGDFQMYNNTERIRCASRNNCSGLLNPQASFKDQARTVAVRDHPAKTVAGFIGDGDFIRFRELNLSFNAPQRWALALRGRSLTATVAARNLGILWTKYDGVDPEAFGTTGDAPSEFQAFAPPTYYMLRFTLGF
jgi:hypothetical protein